MYLSTHSFLRRARPGSAALLGCALALCGSAALAQPRSGEGRPGGERRGPPAEAISACKAAKAGDACGFTSERGTATGSCWAPEGKPLACRPSGAPPAGGNAPQRSSK